MSFILDALKKSETDRQQKTSPGIADVPSATRRASTPPWLPALAVLLLVNLMAVAYLVLRPEVPAAGQPTASAGPAVAATPGASDNSAPEPRPAAAEPSAVRPPPAAVIERRVEEAPRPEAAPETVPQTVAEAPAPSNLPVTEPRSGEPATGNVDDENWLTINDLRASGRLDLPEMHIDLHVFSDTPGDRFVFINMNEYRENATLPEGPTVNRITPEGVLLDYRGTTFLLPRD